jgi:hypothetical protein
MFYLMKKTKTKRQAATRQSQAALTPIPPPPVGALKIDDARSYLGGVTRQTIYRLIRRGFLRPSRGTRHLIFAVVELDRYLKETMEINPRPRKQQAL